MDDEAPLSKHDQQYVAGALECVQLKFPKSENDFGQKDEDGYNVEFAHQHFGESETIFGYQNLSITINYTSASLYIYPEISYSRTSSQGGSDVPPDDICTLLKSQLPEDHMDIMVQNKKEFLRKLGEQKSFQPFGELVRTITIEASSAENQPSAKRARQDPKTFELRKIVQQTPEFERYLAQLQTLALWYIDAAEYTDNDDNWLHYLLFKTYDEIRPDGDTGKRYAIAGYASLYRFYHYRDQQRLRIAHMLVLPPYRQSGLGAKFLNSIYEDLWTMPIIYDITVEDAADSMIYLRDYLDCVHCQTLPEFSCDNLKKGFSAEMEQKARESFKIYSKQSRRIYEILRFIVTNKNDEEELKCYRIDVKRRLEKPFKRRPKDILKLEKCVDPEMVKDMTDMKPEVKLDQLASLYEETIKGYQVVVDRLAAYPTV